MARKAGTGCTQERKDKCAAEGKICKLDSAGRPRCMVRAADKKKAGGRKAAAPRRSRSPTTSMRSPTTSMRSPTTSMRSPTTSLVDGAVLANVGPQTAVSLTTKRRSGKLDAGLPTMRSLTKREIAKLRGGGGGTNRRIDWSQDGLPYGRRSRSRSPTRKPAKKSAKKPAKGGGSGCGTACNPAVTKAGTPRVRLLKPDEKTKKCKCVAMGGRAAKDAGVCKPGTVPVPGPVRKDGTRGMKCVKAGGATAKKVLKSDKACPQGKTLAPYTATVPRLRKRADGTREVVGMMTKQTFRCVKAVGDIKDCRQGLVLARVPHRAGSVTSPTGKVSSWKAGVSVRCVKPKTAAGKGYEVVRRGTLPAPAYRRPRGLALSPGA
jgi:hypothetical protein